MRQNPEQPRQAGAEWYAVDADGGSALRITPGFTIGEAPSGALALNDSSRDRQWLEFQFDSSGLWVEVLADDRALVDADGTLHRRQLLTHGSRLALPHNTLHVSHDIRPARPPGPWLELVAHAPGDAASAAGEPPAESEEQPPEPAASRGPAVLEVVADLRQQLGMAAPGAGSPTRRPRSAYAATLNPSDDAGASGRSPMPGSRVPPLRPPPQVHLDEDAEERPAPRRHAEPRRQRPAARSRRSRGLRAGPLLLFALAAALGTLLAVRGPELLETLEDRGMPAATPGPAVAPPPSDGPAQGPDAGARPPSNWSGAPDTLNVRATAPTAGADAAPGAASADTSAAAPSAPVSQPSAAAPPPHDVLPDGALPAPQEARPEPEAEVIAAAPPGAPAPGITEPFDQQLALARKLIQEGEIITPPGANAVAVLSGVLERAPDHPQARALLAQCSDRLVDSAVRHHEAGRDYQARNTLEEVLSFSPDHAEANRLWRDWVGATP